DVRSHQGREPIRLPAGRVGGLAFHPDRPLLASCSGESSRKGTLQFWDVRTLTPRRPFSEEMQPLSGVAISPDGSTLACTDADNYVRLYHTGTGALLGRRWGLGNSGPVT